MIETLDLVEELPNRVRAILDVAQRGALRVEIDGTARASDTDAPVRYGLANRAIAVFAALVGTGYLLSHKGISRLNELSPASVAVGVSAALMAWLALGVRGRVGS